MLRKFSLYGFLKNQQYYDYFLLLAFRQMGITKLNKTPRRLWGFAVLIFLVLLPALYFEVHWIMISGFVVLYIVQNLWRPVLISRFDAHSDPAKGATVLSIESQAKSLATMIIAPVLGLAIDHVRHQGIGAGQFWPIGVFGLLITLGFFLTSRKSKQEARV